MPRRRPSHLRRKQRLTKKQARLKTRAQRERLEGIDPADAAGRWLDTHDDPRRS